MKTAKTNLLTMGKELRELKLAFKNAQKSNLPEKYELERALYYKKELTRSFHIAYTLTKKRAYISLKSDRADIYDAILSYKIETLPKNNNKMYNFLYPNINQIKTYMQGFKS